MLVFISGEFRKNLARLSIKVARKQNLPADLQATRLPLQSRAAGSELGDRASRLHRYPADFLILSQLDLTRSTLGKSRKSRHLTCAQIMPKFFQEWIKQWIKH
jgi:hypothetical protein